MLDNIMTQIIKDLKIYKVPHEKDSEYFARVIYSAISLWIRVSTLDKDIKIEDSSQIGVNKHRNSIENRIILEGFLELVPQCITWFDTLNGENIIPIIRERLENIGELVSVEKKIVIPDKDSKIYKNRFNKSSINGSFNGGYISGVVWFNDHENFDSIKLEHYANISPSVFVNELVENSKWSKIPSDYEFEIFDPNSRYQFHESWEVINIKKENIVHLARHKLESSLYDYFLVVKTGNQLGYSELSSFFRDEFEIYRICYGLCKIHENFQTVDLREYDNVGVLSLKNRLPNFEQNILKSICWPKSNINDNYNLVFNVDVLPLLEMVFDRLSIRLRRVEH